MSGDANDVGIWDMVQRKSGSVVWIALISPDFCSTDTHRHDYKFSTK